MNNIMFEKLNIRSNIEDLNKKCSNCRHKDLHNNNNICYFLKRKIWNLPYEFCKIDEPDNYFCDYYKENV